MDVIGPEMLSVLAFVVSALIVGMGSLALWIWRRGWHVGRVPRE